LGQIENAIKAQIWIAI